MKAVLKRFADSFTKTVQMLTASFVINLLGLASSLYVILVYGRYLVHGIDTTLITLSLGMLIVIFLEWVMRRIRYRMAEAVCVRAERESSFDIFSGLLRAPLDRLMSMRPHMRNGVMRFQDQVNDSANPSVLTNFLDVPFAMIYLLAAFFISPFIGWTIVGFVLCLFCVLVTMVWYQSHGTKQHLELQRKFGGIIENVRDIESVRAAGAATYLEEKWDAATDQIRWYKFHTLRLQDMMQGVIHSSTLLLTLVVIGFGAQKVIAGELDFGMLMGLNILSARFLMISTRPFSQMSRLLLASEHREFLKGFRQLPMGKNKTTQLDQFTGGVDFQNILFHYPNSNVAAIQGLNLKMQPGQIMKVAGKNGAGKTTFCRLISNLYMPRQGRILVGDVDLRQVNMAWWQQQIIYLPQEVRLITATLRENISFHHPDAGNDALDDAIRNVLDRVGLTGFLNSSAEGLDTMIANGGMHLSVGLRRRIALARGLLTDGPLVILDDPMEGLDSEGVQMMYAMIDSFRQQGKTVFLTTHDPDGLKIDCPVLDLSHKPVPRVVYTQNPQQRASQARAQQGRVMNPSAPSGIL